jgi:hypothetical protein
MSNDETKLPRWAQNALDVARADARSAEERLAAALGTTESRVEIDPYSQLVGRGRSRTFVPDSTTIRFKIRGGHIDVQLKDERLEIMGSGPVGSFSIKPSASNNIYVTFDDT